MSSPKTATSKIQGGSGSGKPGRGPPNSLALEQPYPVEVANYSILSSAQSSA